MIGFTTNVLARSQIQDFVLFQLFQFSHISAIWLLQPFNYLKGYYSYLGCLILFMFLKISYFRYISDMSALQEELCIVALKPWKGNLVCFSSNASRGTNTICFSNSILIDRYYWVSRFFRFFKENRGNSSKLLTVHEASQHFNLSGNISCKLSNNDYRTTYTGKI